MSSYSPRPADVRRAPRIEVCYRCELSGLSATPVPGLIVDISPLGCMVRCTTEAAPNTMISFILPIVGAWRGQVVWAIGARMGIQFERPIPETPYQVMLGHLSRPGSAMDII